MAVNVRVSVDATALRQVLSAIGQVDAKAEKILIKDITDGAKRVAVAASYLAPGSNPVSNWGTWTYSRDGRDLSFDPATVAAGFKVRRNNFRRRGTKESRGIGWDVYQGNAAGAIYELMGTGNRVTTASGASLVGTVNSRFSARRPRALFAAYYQVNTPGFREAILQKIIAEARRVGLT